jgi:hypothetical protein
MAADLEISLNFFGTFVFIFCYLSVTIMQKKRSQSNALGWAGCAHKIAFSITACFHDLMISFP